MIEWSKKCQKGFFLSWLVLIFGPTWQRLRDRTFFELRSHCIVAFTAASVLFEYWTFCVHTDVPLLISPTDRTGAKSRCKRRFWGWTNVQIKQYFATPLPLQSIKVRKITEMDYRFHDNFVPSSRCTAFASHQESSQLLLKDSSLLMTVIHTVPEPNQGNKVRQKSC